VARNRELRHFGIDAAELGLHHQSFIAIQQHANVNGSVAGWVERAQASIKLADPLGSFAARPVGR
jgi:hypothetical protein